MELIDGVSHDESRGDLTDQDDPSDDFDFDDEESVSALDAREKTKRRLFLRRTRSARGQPASTATVRMRHEASGAVFVWQTAGVKDASGGELHEGAAYRLVASVRDTPNVLAREVGVTRCRLTLISGDG